MRRRLAVPLVLTLLLAAQPACRAAKPVASEAPTFTTRIEFTIDGEGRVTEAKLLNPPADPTTVMIQQALLKKAWSWQFEPFVWNGEPASSTFSRFIDVQLAPTTTGGIALRVKGINANTWVNAGPESMPKRQSVSYRAKHDQYLMLFRVATGADGRPTQVDRLQSEHRFPQGMNVLVDAREEMLREWRQAPAVVDGVPVACSRLYVMQSLPDRIGSHAIEDQQGWYEDIDLSRLLPDEATRVRAAFAATPDRCPPPRLRTAIEGTLL